MSWQPLLDGNPYTFTKDDLPALIHGEEHSGASLFSITLLAQLYKRGDPIVLISAHNAAKTAVIEQTQSADSFITIQAEEDIAQADQKQVIHISKDNEALLAELLATISDKDDRVILLKNMELFSDETLASIYKHPFAIFSGDLNTSSAKESLLQLKYNAKIFFSPLQNDFRLTLPELEKYHGYFLGRLSQGIVALTKDPQE